MRVDKEMIYSRSPLVFQNLLVSIEGFRIKKRRYSKLLYSKLKEVTSRDHITKKQLEQYIQIRLKAFLFNANKSQYWQNTFSKFNININSNDPINELLKLPILNKDTVKIFAKEFIPNNLTKVGLLPCHTSGTTGSGLNFWETQEAEKEQWAIWWRYRMRHGISTDSNCLYFGGRSIVPTRQVKPPYWRINFPGKQLFFSAYHLNEKTAIEYLKKIRSSKYRWIHGYPSFIAQLARFKLDFDKQPLDNLKWITVGAESLMEHQKRIIKEAFGLDVIQHYGLREGVANISQCEYGKLHVDEDFSYVEFIPVNGTDFYKIIGTNWSNPAFPLFRYDTGDLCKLSSENSCPCGRNSRIVEEIDGRKEDFIILPNGTYVGRLDHIFKDLININEAQIYQHSTKHIEFRIVRGEKYVSYVDEKKLLDEAYKRLGDKIKISIKYLDSIPKTSSGKLRFVISNLKKAKIG